MCLSLDASSIVEEAFQSGVCECSFCGTSYLTVLHKCNKNKFIQSIFFFKHKM